VSPVLETAAGARASAAQGELPRGAASQSAPREGRNAVRDRVPGRRDPDAVSDEGAQVTILYFDRQDYEGSRQMLALDMLPARVRDAALKSPTTWAPLSLASMVHAFGEQGAVDFVEHYEAALQLVR